MRGTGRVVFASIMLTILGVMNVIYGIGALDSANVFVNDTRLIFSDLNTYGWILIVLGIFQLAAGFSLMSGQTFGRVFAIAAGSLGAFVALISVGGAFPWYSLAVFFLCIWVVHGIVIFGEDEREATARGV